MLHLELKEECRHELSNAQFLNIYTEKEKFRFCTWICIQLLFQLYFFFQFNSLLIYSLHNVQLNFV